MSHYALINRLVEPAIEPVDLLEAKSHLRILSDDEVPDDDILATIIVAREKVENETRRALITQTWKASSTHFPLVSDCPIYLEFPPLQSVTSVTYIDIDEVQQIWDSNLYEVNTAASPGFILPKCDEEYPETGCVNNAVEIEYIAGYGGAADDVPASIKHAMKLIIGELYSRREEALVGASITTVPISVKNLVDPYRVTYF